MFGPFFVKQYSFISFKLTCQGRESWLFCFNCVLVVMWLLLLCAVGSSMVCDSDISWSCSLTF